MTDTKTSRPTSRLRARLPERRTVLRLGTAAVAGVLAVWTAGLAISLMLAVLAGGIALAAAIAAVMLGAGLLARLAPAADLKAAADAFPGNAPVWSAD